MHINNYSIKCSVGDKDRDIFTIWTSFSWKLIEALMKATGFVMLSFHSWQGSSFFWHKASFSISTSEEMA